MNKKQIVEILNCCLLATDGVDLDYLVKEGFNPKLAKMGLQLYSYLEKKS